MNSAPRTNPSPLPDNLRTRVLDRLEFTSAPSLDHAGLCRLYQAWCRNVPFDNAALLIQDSGAERRNPLPLSTERFFEGWLLDGMGGLCVPTALAWQALLASLHYEARCVIGSIDCNDQPDHLTVIVRLSDAEHVVDTVNLCERPIRLSEGRTASPYPVHDVTVERHGTSWRLRYRTAALRKEQSCLLHPRNVGHAEAEDLYVATLATPRFRQFNSVHYARRNVVDGILVVLGNGVTRVDHEGTATFSWNENLERALLDEIGYSPAVVRELLKRNERGRK